MNDLDFHLLKPRILYGYALDESWLVDVASPVAVGEFVEVLSSYGRAGNQVMAQGRVTRARSHSPVKSLLDLSPVTALMLLEASCAAR